MILVFVIIAVLTAVMVLGISIGSVLYNPIVEQFDSGPLRGVVAQRTGARHGNDVAVRMTVSQSTTVTVTDLQSEQSASLGCTETCQVTLLDVGHGAGTINVTAGGDTGRAGYPPKP
jgi:hypothetical protein